MQPGEAGDAFIAWDEERYSTNIERFDEQHKQLFDLLNDLHVAMEQGRSEEKIGDILRELERYTEYHFGDEEEFMQDCGFAMDCADCFFNHREMHDEFAQKVTELREKHENGEYITMEVLMFARDWLDSHIAGMNQDQNYGNYYVEDVPEDYEYEPGTLKKDRKKSNPHGSAVAAENRAAAADSEEERARDFAATDEAETEPREVTLGSDIYEGESLSVPDGTMADWIETRQAEYGDRPATILRDGGLTERTVADICETAHSVAAGLLAVGLEPGDRVGIYAGTRPEWLTADLACYLAGLVSVPVSGLYSNSRAAHVVSDAGIDLLVTDRSLPDRIEAEVPEVRRITDLPTGDADELPGTDADPDDVATIAYRIGTNEHPRGCAITHRNLRAATEMLATALPLSPGSAGTCLLPPEHMYQRVLTYYLLDAGSAVAYFDADALVEGLTAVEPTVLVGVPQVYEQLHEEIENRRNERGGLRGKIAGGVAETVGEAKNEGRSLSTTLSLKHTVADRTVFSSLRAELGLANVEYALTGTAPIDTDLLEFFRGFGVPLSEIYGATELSGLATLNEAGEFDAETAGAPLPGTEIALADDGEILVRGPNVIEQYWDDATAWRRKIHDGWYHTGDLGEFDDEGALRILGPK